MSNRLDKEREAELQPQRVEFAARAIRNKGKEIIDITSKSIKFIHKQSEVTLYPYSGWFSGKTVVDGRGIDNLLKQIS